MTGHLSEITVFWNGTKTRKVWVDLKAVQYMYGDSYAPTYAESYDVTIIGLGGRQWMVALPFDEFSRKFTYL